MLYTFTFTQHTHIYRISTYLHNDTQRRDKFIQTSLPRAGVTAYSPSEQLQDAGGGGDRGQQGHRPRRGQEAVQGVPRRGLPHLQVRGRLPSALLVVLQKVPSEFHPKVRNHGEGPY